MSIASEITRIGGNIAAAYTAAGDKGANLPQTQNSANLADTIAAIPQSSGGAVTKKDINFFDYDGLTLLYSYTFAEAAALTELPELPAHTGFIAQGWTSPLAQIKSAGEDEYRLDVGATYVTTDGSTKLYVYTTAGTKLPTIRINLKMAANSSATIDWGDGTTGTISNSGSSDANVYAEKSDYSVVNQDTTFCIKISGGSFKLGHGSDDTPVAFVPSIYGPPNLVRAELGTNCTGLSNYALYKFMSLAAIVIPQNVTAFGNYAFASCSSLRSVVMPSSNGLDISDYAFSGCRSLISIILPYGLQTISIYVFKECSALLSITIPQSVTYVSYYAFYNCYSLASIVIPESVTYFEERAFYYCTSLLSAIILGDITNLSTFLFRGCERLTSIAIPHSVISIQQGAFESCYRLYMVDLSGYTSADQIPYLYNSGVFPSTVQVFKVHDASMIAAFESATNWSAYAGKYVV